MADPPRLRSSAVALNVERRAAPGGRGTMRTLPAHKMGPSISPPGRAIAKLASVMSELERDGVPLSCGRILRRYRFPFGAVPMSHVEYRADPGKVAIGVDVNPPSALEPNVNVDSTTPVPYAR